MWRFILFWLLLTSVVDAQNNFDIIFSSPNHQQVCQTCEDAFMQKPKEIQFSIKREGTNLFLEITDKDWLKRVIRNADDGIAIDVVSKERYACSLPQLAETQVKGVLLKPMYGPRLVDGLKPHGKQLFRVLVGRLTPELAAKKDLEYNLLFLIQKRMCRYQVIYNLESYPWDLLDMGMYLDSITYQNQSIKSSSTDQVIKKYKTIVFQVPFEKNKSVYAPSDIKPLYDSLRLTNFHIKTIQIKGYASVEGTTERNLELQQQRAKSLADALQSFQKPSIQTDISSSENWVEFFNDIQNTKYADWKHLSKEQIKAKLVGNLSKEMEPILQNHRKAVVRLELEKIDRFENMTGDQLVGKFHDAIKNDRLTEAQEIQNSIFEKMQAKVVSPDLFSKLQLPKQIKYVGFLNNNAAFKAWMDEQESLIVYHELLDLEKLAPKDGKVKYNLAALRIKLWRYKVLEIKEPELRIQINDLKKFGISQVLIDRLLINLHIIKAENQMRQRDFKNKDLSVAFIEKNYQKIPLSNQDYLSLAQFFTYYANIDKAATLLEGKSRQIDIDEDLLFYYINLTVINKELIEKQDYRTILLNASNLNLKRFCRLFEPVEKGGVTFQMLESDFLRGVYCEVCK